MNRLDQLHAVLDKYKLTNPVLPEIQDEVYSARKKTLIVILKHKKKLSIFSIAVLSLYFWIKKSGIAVTITNAIVAALTVTSVTIGAVSYGTYYTVKKIILKNEVEKKIKEKKDTGDKPEIIKKTREEALSPKKSRKTKTVTPDPEIHFGIVPFEADSNSTLSNEVSRMVFSELQNIKGMGKILLADKKEAKSKAKRIILGSISKLGKIYRISVRIVDSKSSKVVGFYNEKATSKNELKNACKKLSQKIAQSIE